MPVFFGRPPREAQARFSSPVSTQFVPSRLTLGLDIGSALDLNVAPGPSARHPASALESATVLHLVIPSEARAFLSRPWFLGARDTLGAQVQPRAPGSTVSRAREIKQSSLGRLYEVDGRCPRDLLFPF